MNEDGGIETTQSGHILFDSEEKDKLEVFKTHQVKQLSPATENQYNNFLDNPTSSKQFQVYTTDETISGSFNLTDMQIEKIKNETISFDFKHSMEAKILNQLSKMGFDVDFKLQGNVTISYLAKSKIDRGIIFDDITLENEIRKELGKFKGPITIADCNQITRLSLKNKNITSLNGLENCSSLEFLEVSNNPITSLSALVSHPNLNTLHLSSTKVTSLKDLSLSSKLRTISMNNTSIKSLKGIKTLPIDKLQYRNSKVIVDFSKLKNMSVLKELDINNSKEFDFNNIKDLLSLKILKANDMKILNINSITTNLNLEYLQLTNTDLKNLNWLKNLVKIKDLTIHKNPITEMPDLSLNPSLTTLRMGQTNITNLNFLENVRSQIKYLDIWNSYKVSNFDYFKTDNPTLRGINLTNYTISDSFKGTFTNLKYTHLWNTSISDLSNLLNSTNLHTINFGNNNVQDISTLLNLSKLRYIYNKNNNIANIGDVREKWENLVKIDLINNPLSCSSANALHYYKYYLLTVSFDEVENCAITEENPILKFASFLADVNLNYTIRKKIDYLKDNLTEDLTANLTQLDASNKQIINLTGIEKITSLTNLNLSNNQLSNFSPLLQLVNLKTLSLDNTDLTDISQLSNLPLTSLSVKNNDLTNLTSLEGFNFLQELKITGVTITCADLTILENLINKGVNVDFDMIKGCDTSEPEYLTESMELGKTIQISFSDLNSSNHNTTSQESSLIVINHPENINTYNLIEAKVTINVEKNLNALAKNFNSSTIQSRDIQSTIATNLSSESLDISQNSFTLSNDYSFRDIKQSSIDQYQTYHEDNSLFSSLFDVNKKTLSSTEELIITNLKLDSFKSNSVTININTQLSSLLSNLNPYLLNDVEESVTIKITVEYKYQIN